MIYTPGQKCWSLEDGNIKQHIIEDVGFTPLTQIIKIDGLWHVADAYFSKLEKAKEAEERYTFRMFK